MTAFIPPLCSPSVHVLFLLPPAVTTRPHEVQNDSQACPSPKPTPTPAPGFIPPPVTCCQATRQNPSRAFRRTSIRSSFLFPGSRLGSQRKTDGDSKLGSFPAWVDVNEGLDSSLPAESDSINTLTHTHPQEDVLGNPSASSPDRQSPQYPPLMTEYICFCGTCDSGKRNPRGSREPQDALCNLAAPPEEGSEGEGSWRRATRQGGADHIPRCLDSWPQDPLVTLAGSWWPGAASARIESPDQEGSRWSAPPLTSGPREQM